MRLPWWFWLAYADVKFWYATAPAAIALALTTWFAAPWPGGLRWFLIAVVVLLALPFPAAAAVVAYQKFDATRYWRTLDVAETITGLTVPAGSKVLFADKKHSIPVSIEMPHVTEIRGMRLTGTLRPLGNWGDVGKVWGGILGRACLVNGIHPPVLETSNLGDCGFKSCRDRQPKTLTTTLKLATGTAADSGALRVLSSQWRKRHAPQRRRTS